MSRAWRSLAGHMDVTALVLQPQLCHIDGLRQGAPDTPRSGQRPAGARARKLGGGEPTRPHPKSQCAHRLVIVGMRPKADAGATLVQLSGILDRLGSEYTIVNPVLGAVQLGQFLRDPDPVIEIREFGHQGLPGLGGSPQEPHAPFLELAAGPAVLGDDGFQEVGVVGVNSAALPHDRLRPRLTVRNGHPNGLVSIHAPQQFITK